MTATLASAAEEHSFPYGLGCLFEKDEQDKKFPMSAFLEPGLRAAQFPSYTWGLKRILNQENSSSCVGHAFEHFLYAAPLEIFDGPGPFDIYNEAQLLDNIDGQEPLVQGTTIRAGAKFLSKKGYIDTYAWARSANDVKRWILSRGPVVFGTEWYADMFTPGVDGFVTPTGEFAGGHAYLCLGYTQDIDAFTFANSWGETWGRSGLFFMKTAYVELLLRRDGEACAAIERKP